jgi:hypothetical protein
MDAFLPHVLTTSVFANYEIVAENGFELRLRGGPLVWYGTQSGLLDHPEVFGVYAVQAGYVGAPAEIFAGLGGRAILTESPVSPDRRFTDQAVVAAHLNLGRVEPGVSVRVPLDNGRNEVTGSVVGLSLRLAIP